MAAVQVAFQLPGEDLGELDQLAAAERVSRAELLRQAVAELLERRREAAIDRALAAGYITRPPGPEERVWADVSIEGVIAADLDW